MFTPSVEWSLGDPTPTPDATFLHWVPTLSSGPWSLLQSGSFFLIEHGGLGDVMPWLLTIVAVYLALVKALRFRRFDAAHERLGRYAILWSLGRSGRSVQNLGITAILISSFVPIEAFIAPGYRMEELAHDAMKMACARIL
ncbi:hypothetical protein B0H16DRAFT_1877769 [Mycena metata]|uniref:Uncharacterized protein n=1 Tax=Mycena metata TaxID=1033252 RepID=A0AAD7KB68_9AGAR|nr:hypothetical protein B0H16DRAFT_1877769 [Mycena metata]